ncbi:hypothetical protein ACHAP5_011615, partial [Fusarium lateritium]
SRVPSTPTNPIATASINVKASSRPTSTAVAQARAFEAQLALQRAETNFTTTSSLSDELQADPVRR